ncbi:hypothetical protein B0G84_3306 [Paraburkholderia sp. BL8N3]|nr:hypothetical protein [Paraburkholderia sp. BL8N3]TCK38003.1 hypothetical protein B0G84_3306 [Paraburkholderia sp. BL8N3]
MIDFQRHDVKIAHLNVRSELHGDDEVLAIDLRLECDLPNVRLDQLAPHLRASLYTTDDERPDLIDTNGEHLPHLRYPALGALAWDADIQPVRLSLHLGGKPKDDLLLSEARLNKIRLAPREGGTFGYICRIQTHPTEDEAAKLMMLLRHSVKATLDVADAAKVDGADDEND